MVYTVYKTTNLVNEKYYLGVHKTDNPEDEYLGSGLRLRRSVRKHGSENFQKEILYIFETQNEAFKKENELIVQYKSDDKCMNLAWGGQGKIGGWNKGQKHSPETKAKMSATRKGKTPKLTKKRLAALQRNSKLAAGKPRPNHWTKDPLRNAKNSGPKFSDETKEKMRKSRYAYFKRIGKLK